MLSWFDKNAPLNICHSDLQAIWVSIYNCSRRLKIGCSWEAALAVCNSRYWQNYISSFIIYKFALFGFCFLQIRLFERYYSLVDGDLYTTKYYKYMVSQDDLKVFVLSLLASTTGYSSSVQLYSPKTRSWRRRENIWSRGWRRRTSLLCSDSVPCP